MFGISSICLICYCYVVIVSSACVCEIIPYLFIHLILIKRVHDEMILRYVKCGTIQEFWYKLEVYIKNQSNWSKQFKLTHYAISRNILKMRKWFFDDMISFRNSCFMLFDITVYISNLDCSNVSQHFLLEREALKKSNKFTVINVTARNIYAML